jgi:hypothetical protein
VLVALPLAVAAVGVTLWAGPYWLGVARQAAAEHRWPEERAVVEAAVAALQLPAGYATVPCPEPSDDDARCWRVAAEPDRVQVDLEAALTAVGAQEVTALVSELPRYGPVGATVHGSVAGRVLVLLGDRELLPREPGDPIPPGGPFADTVLVRLSADLAPPDVA